MTAEATTPSRPQSWQLDIDGDGIYGEKEEEKAYAIQHRETYIEPNDAPRK